MTRIQEIQQELAELGRLQEEGLAIALAHALTEAQAVASPDSAARASVRNEARRLVQILDRERGALAMILRNGQ